MEEREEPTGHMADRPLPAHGADGKFIATPENAERDAEAAMLFGRGNSYRQIARTLGYASHSGAQDAVSRGLDAIRRRGGEEAGKLHAERLQAIRMEAAEMTAAARGILGRRHLAYNNRGVVEWDGEPLEDDAPKLAAIDRVLAAQRLILAADEREAKLLGLDAKQEVAVDGGLRYEIVGVPIEEITGEVATGE